MPRVYTVGEAPCLLIYHVILMHDIDAHLEATVNGTYYKELHLEFYTSELPYLQGTFTVIEHGDTGTTTYYGVKNILHRGRGLMSATSAMRVLVESEYFDSLADQRLRKLALLQ